VLLRTDKRLFMAPRRCKLGIFLETAGEQVCPSADW